MEKCATSIENLKEYSVTDCNVFIGEWPFRKLSCFSKQKLINSPEETGIAKMWVSSFEGVFFNNTFQANRLLYEMTKDIPAFVTFASMNPTLPGWEEHMEKCKFEYNMKGIRIYPNYHNYTLTSASFYSLIQKAASLSFPICIYCRLADERVHPHFSKVPPVDLTPLQQVLANISSFPPIVICNCGMGDIIKIGALLKENSNTYIEISHLESIGIVKKLAGEIGVEKILFGTYTPYFYRESSYLKIQEADLNKTEMHMIFFTNAEKILPGI